MKILQVGFSSNPGGVENVVMNYYRFIDRNKVQFDFLDMYGEGLAFAEEIRSLGGKIVSIDNYKHKPIAAYIHLKRIIMSNKYDAVHIHMQSAANILPVIASIKCKCKTICHSHSSSTPKGIVRKLLNGMNKHFLRRMDVYKWACGIRAGRWMWGNSFETHNVIINAIDMKGFKRHDELRNEYRSKYGFGYENKVIGFVGRFGTEKNTLFLLDILEELLKRSDDYRLLTVGGNDEYEVFYKKLREKKLDDYYYSAGVQKNTSNWYQVMDCFLLPSFFEGFPMTAVEAQVAGVPCVFSDCISIEIKISSNVMFLPIGDKKVKCWADHIEKLLNKKTNIQEQIDQRYDIRNASRILEKRYMGLMSETVMGGNQ